MTHTFLHKKRKKAVEAFKWMMMNKYTLLLREEKKVKIWLSCSIIKLNEPSLVKCLKIESKLEKNKDVTTIYTKWSCNPQNAYSEIVPFSRQFAVTLLKQYIIRKGQSTAHENTLIAWMWLKRIWPKLLQPHWFHWEKVKYVLNSTAEINDT